MINRQPGFSSHLLSIEPQLAFTGANLPLLLKSLARMTNEGAYGNTYPATSTPPDSSRASTT
jgi:phospholipid/cholesterol/gamma-HCH transport system substrate-binding protein